MGKLRRRERKPLGFIRNTLIALGITMVSLSFYFFIECLMQIKTQHTVLFDLPWYYTMTFIALVVCTHFHLVIVWRDELYE